MRLNALAKMYVTILSIVPNVVESMKFYHWCHVRTRLYHEICMPESVLLLIKIHTANAALSKQGCRADNLFHCTANGQRGNKTTGGAHTRTHTRGSFSFGHFTHTKTQKDLIIKWNQWVTTFSYCTVHSVQSETALQQARGVLQFSLCHFCQLQLYIAVTRLFCCG